MSASLLSPSVEATPIKLKWQNATGVHDGTFDLSDPEDRKSFRETFTKNPQVLDCIARADYAVELMSERDAGTTEKYHLDTMEVNYERTKTEPEGVVAWHVYVDFQRMVRDIHRRAGRNAQLGYRHTNANVVWDREFQWCAT